MRPAITLVAVIACYAPHPETGAPCAAGVCPSGLVCSPATDTCELAAMPPPGDAVATSEPPGPDGPAAPPNDLPANAIDVTAGGTFTADLLGATDDAPELDCHGAGGRDVFYSVTLAAAQVYYFDTFASDFATVLRVVPGVDCTAIATGSDTCSDGACGGAQSQLAISLPAGTSCIIVDQHADDPNGMLQLAVVPGGRDGGELGSGVNTYADTSCTGVNVTRPGTPCTSGDSGSAEDRAYFFTACPMQTRTLDATTCADATMTHFDTVVYLRAVASTANLACNDDDASCMARTERPSHPDGSTLTGAVASGANLYWLTVDGYGGACGVYQLVTDLQ